MRAAWIGAVAAAMIATGLGATPELHGWDELTFDNKRPNQWRFGDDGSVEVLTDSSVSVLFRPVSADFEAAPCLSWQWRVDAAVPPTDLARKGGDDRSVAVYVSFPYDPDRATLWERVRRVIVEMVEGPHAPGRVVTYVWGGIRGRGTMFESPYMGSAGMQVILRPADSPVGQWFEETVDVAADYGRAFNDPPPPPMQIGLSADSDDTATRSAATVRDIRFHPCGMD